MSKKYNIKFLNKRGYRRLDLGITDVWSLRFINSYLQWSIYANKNWLKDAYKKEVGGLLEGS